MEKKLSLEACYTRMGGDYRDVYRRLQSEERIARFLSLFTKDTSYRIFCEALAGGNAEEAFRAVHSLKGISLNLGLTALSSPSTALADLLRNGKITPEVEPLAQQLTQAYQSVIQAICEFAR